MDNGMSWHIYSIPIAKAWPRERCGCLSVLEVHHVARDLTVAECYLCGATWTTKADK
jgi:hypothetical protein